ncbi:winged helix-turn-helix domain-containing protein [Streptomyces sp. NPDC047315]|uniref:winged helix-turn-helix domain-containing protein n=1 Tax=Streptomyces sp. NPDC047315 TaxID=3155142 RepID=UPI0033E9A874
MPEPPERTALYRYFDAEGVLLYIGISNDPDNRARAHRYEPRPDGWPERAVRREDEWHRTRAAALAAEAEAIRAERPLYNGTHNYADAAFNPASWPQALSGRKVAAVAGLMRSEILSGRWSSGQRIPSLRVLSRAAGVGVRAVSKASTQLQAEGLLDLQPGRGLFVRSAPGQRPRLPHDWYRAHGFPG